MVHFKEAILLPFQNFKKLTLGATFFLFSALGSLLSSQQGFRNDLPSILVIQLTLMIIGWLLSFVVTGYGLIVACNSIKHRFILPEFENILNLFIKGLLSAVIVFIYSLPALFILFLSIGIIIFTSVSSRSFTPFLAGIPVIVVGLIILLMAAYVSPAALFRYAETDNFGNAFDVRTVFRKAFTGSWLAAMVVSTIYYFFLLIIAGLFMFGLRLFSDSLPYAALLLSAVLISYLSMITMLTYSAMLGDAYGAKK